jgi:2-polyprenyl-6-methoxyphenol hydroxylase-like FAD-dependent oxidoreductase
MEPAMSERPDFLPRYDAVVVGGRVAGAATAMLLARQGRQVLMLEKTAHGTDTLSTHALMRPGVMQLARWGLLDRIVDARTPAIRRTTFHYDAEAIVVDIRARDGVDALYAPRRTVLDSLLSDAAREAGAQVAHRCAVQGLLSDATGRVRGVRFVDSLGRSHTAQAGFVIGADGVHSTVARAVGAELTHRAHHATAVMYAYWRGLHLDGTHWYYGKDLAVGAIPTNDDLTCVFVAMRPERFTATPVSARASLFHTLVEASDPRLAAALADAARPGKFYSFAGAPGYIRRSSGAGWALVGDAAYFKDPITAHGMTDALRDAELLARALADGTDTALARYERERDAFAVEFLHLSAAIASFDWDLPRLKQLHDRQSRLLGGEYDRLRTLGAVHDDSAQAVTAPGQASGIV